MFLLLVLVRKYKNVFPLLKYRFILQLTPLLCGEGLSAIFLTGNLMPGDQILEVNGDSLIGVTSER